MVLREGEWASCDNGHTASGGGVMRFGLGGLLNGHSISSSQH